jgi:hypothetical protein
MSSSQQLSLSMQVLVFKMCIYGQVREEERSQYLYEELLPYVTSMPSLIISSDELNIGQGVTDSGHQFPGDGSWCFFAY